MGRSGSFVDDLEGVFGKGSVTSGYRTQAEQDALRARGATKAVHSSHTTGNGYDLAINAADSEQTLRERASKAGLGIGKVIRETGVGPNQGTGAHWHIEIDKDKKMAGISTDFLDDILTPQGGTPPATAVAIMPDAENQFKERAGRAQTALDNQDQFLDNYGKRLETVQANAKAAVEQKVTATRAINEEVQAATASLKDRVKPIFEVRQRVQDQLDKVATMNPIERGIRGIFDLNYDQKHLEGQLKNFDESLARRGQDYEFLNSLQAKQMQLIESEFGNNKDLANVELTDMDQDAKMINARLSSAMDQMKFVGESVSQESQLLNARRIQRADLMDSMDGAQLASLTGKAKANGGKVNYNGVELNVGELTEYADKAELQDLQIQGARLAKTNQAEELAERHATQLARTLTSGQARQAAANGGVYKGVQLPQDVLTSVILSHQQRDTALAAEMGTESGWGAAAKVGVAIMDKAKLANARANSMFGGGGNTELKSALVRIASRVSDLSNTINGAAQKRDGNRQAMTQMYSMMQTANQEFDTAINTVAEKYAGGDKKAAGYIGGFLRGEAIDSQTGTEAMVYFANKGTLPTAMRASPAARAAFKAAQGAILATDEEMRSGGKKMTQEQRTAAILQKAAAGIPRAFTDQNLNSVIDQLPQFAAIAGDAFKGMDPAAFQRARMMADRTGFEVIGHQLGLSAGEAESLYRGEYKAKDGQDINSLTKSMQEMQGRLSAVQHEEFIKNLDQLPTVKPGMSNSSALLGLLQSPKFAAMVSRYEDNHLGVGFGEYLAGNASKGALMDNIGSWATNLKGIQIQQDADMRNQSQALSRQYANQPLKRAQAVLGAIPGIDEHQEALLLAEIRRGVATQNSSVLDLMGQGFAAMGQGLPANGEINPGNAAIRNFLKSTKFQDPRLEAVRKVAAQHWDDYADSTDRAFNRIARK